ncbi:carbohydrate-binding protein [Streptomyces sp. TRM49041]|uniref:carbohydrate-binding protein n=1 Tax=Streptomyces sp. TRM49041 TaxID=2603216 RepID=UPI0011EEB917|nr:carbohydrate-binding protein [Streptomyces sp. TRM49041]
MLPRHARAACTAALAAVGVLVLSALPGVAAAEPAPPATPSAATSLGADKPSPDVLAAMQRDLGLTKPQAQQRLVNEAEAGALAGRLRGTLGADYAGAWVRGAVSATLTVATTDPAHAAAIRAAGAQAKVVGHSAAALDAAKAALDRAALRTNTLNMPVWYVDVRTNSVTVKAANRSAAEAFITASGADPSLFRAEVSAERPRPLYDIRGGDAYHMGGGRCSIGFAVTRGTQHGFATAGHCGPAGAATSGYNQVAQGTFQASSFPGSDMAWVATNTDWRSTPYVKGQAGQNVQVTGSAQAVVGASVCRSGSTTGWHCGTILQHNTSVTYPEGTVSGVTRTSVCAEPGDSGGSYISGSQAQGVASGGSGDCRGGGTTYHQPVNPILQTYGLTLTTTQAPGDPGDPGVPGDPGGTWSAGTVHNVGDQVTYGGATYLCLQSHQARTGWEPPSVPALWQRL